MASNFVGSNNLNYLLPIGQFGSRNMGGKEAASPRYIYTNLNRITRYLFPEPDGKPASSHPLEHGRAHAHAHARTRAHVRTCTHIHTGAHTRTCTYARTRAHTLIRTPRVSASPSSR